MSPDPSTPAPASEETPRNDVVESEGSMNTLGELPGLKDPQRIEDVKELSQSASEAFKDYEKISTMKEDELVKKYRERYSSILSGSEITRDERMALKEEEFGRINSLASETAQAEIVQINKGKPMPEYTEAIRRVTGSEFRRIDTSRDTSGLITGLDLNNEKTSKLFDKMKKLEQLKNKRSKAEAKLVSYEKDLEAHQAKFSEIEARQTLWDAKKWEYVKGPLKLAGVLGVAGLIGAGTFWAGAGFAGLLAGKAWFGAVATSYGTAISSTWGALTGATGIGSIGLAGVAAGVWNSGVGAVNKWFGGKGRVAHDIEEGRLETALRKKREELKIDTDLKYDIDEAQATVDKYTAENAKKASDIDEHIGLYQSKQEELTNEIDNASEDDDTSQTEEDLEKTGDMILMLESINEVLRSGDRAEKLGLEGNISNNKILKRINAMKIDEERKSKMTALMARIDDERKKAQTELQGAEYKEGVKKEVNLLDNPAQLRALNAFLSRPDAKLGSTLEKIKTDSPNLYRTLKAMEVLPKGNMYRERVRELLQFALSLAEGGPQRASAQELFDSLPADQQKFLKGKPGEICEFSNHSAADLPRPEPRQTFERWIKSIQNPVHLNNLVGELERIRTDAAVEKGKLVDKMTPLKKKILVDGLETLHPDIQSYLGTGAAAKLEQAAAKLGHPLSISLTTPDSGVRENVESMADMAELKKIQDLLPKIKSKLFLNKVGDEFELRSDAEAEITRAIETIPKKLKDKIKNNSALVHTFSVGGHPDLDAPGPGSLAKYGETFIGTEKMPRFLEVLGELASTPYILKPDGTLEKEEDNLKANIMDSITSINANIQRDAAAAGVVAPALNAHKLTPEMLDKAFTVARRERRRVPQLPRDGVRLEEKIENATNIDQLKEILYSCEEVISNCYYDKDAQELKRGSARAVDVGGGGTGNVDDLRREMGDMARQLTDIVRILSESETPDEMRARFNLEISRLQDVIDGLPVAGARDEDENRIFEEANRMIQETRDNIDRIP